MNKAIVIIGAGGHGKVIADIAKLNMYDSIVFLDDSDEVTCCGQYPVVGKIGSYADHRGHDFIVAIGNNKIRQRIQDKLTADGMNIVTLIHPNAVVAQDVSIDDGSVVMAGAVINSGTQIGKGVIVNTCSSVDHDCVLNAFVHISPGVHLAGRVTVGERTWIGIGATVCNNICICSDCTIGAGAAVIRDIEQSGTYIGVPARRRNEDLICNDDIADYKCFFQATY